MVVVILPCPSLYQSSSSYPSHFSSLVAILGVARQLPQSVLFFILNRGRRRGEQFPVASSFLPFPSSCLPFSFLRSSLLHASRRLPFNPVLNCSKHSSNKKNARRRERGRGQLIEVSHMRLYEHPIVSSISLSPSSHLSLFSLLIRGHSTLDLPLFPSHFVIPSVDEVISRPALFSPLLLSSHPPSCLSTHIQL